VDAQRVLLEGGAALAEFFKAEPLRQPINPQFAPYYEQVLQGNAKAIIQYCDEHWEQELANSFHEIVGRLFLLKRDPVAETILTNIAGRPTPGWPSNRRAYGYWYQKLKALCKRARAWLGASLKNSPSDTRDQRWQSYVEQHQQAVQTTLLQEQGHGIVMISVCNLGREAATPINCTVEEVSESSRLMSLVNAFGSFNLVPREIFDELALTKSVAGKRTFRFSPSEVARKYACKIVGISESTASHM
jgi:hypothetical protein